MKQKKFGTWTFAGDGPVFIGIDQSYSGFGLTVLGEGGYSTTVTKFESRGVNRLTEVQHHIYASLAPYHSGFFIKDAAMEGYAYGSQMANMAGELGAAVKLTLYQEFGITPLVVSPTALKKYVTGKGNAAGKSQIMLQVYKKFGVELLDDNAADSYALAKIASGAATLAYEKEVLEMLKDPKFRDEA